ncbi:caspase domain-containing protein [Collybia nuda]|uniref:Caspase domain-containing protein n=1 Tax=Collybia nuda TaxID=64659 RepID=A0A9P5Y2M0_9AGAR|nr:caspase domain-containing protein [Collybia nuda]
MGWNWKRSVARTHHVFSLGFLGAASWTPWKKTTSQGCKKALLIGINYGKDLTGPQKDVGRMKRILIEKYGYKERDIVVLTDRADVCEKLQPTQENIMRELTAFLTGQQPGDRFFFMFAGHADQKKAEDINSDEEDGMDERIVPSDALADDGTVIDDKVIKDDVLKDYLVNRLHPNNRLIAIFDSCHSGTLLDLPHHRCNRVTSSLSRVRRTIRRGREIFTFPAVTRTSHKRSRSDDTLQGVPSLSKYGPSQSGSIIDSRSLLGSVRRTIRRGRTIITIRSVKASRLPSHTRGYSDETLKEAPPRPKPKRTCSGYCPRIEKSNQYVLCISACKDDQTMYENNTGTSLCMIITELLENDPCPTLKAFMRKTGEALESHGKQLEEQWVEYEKKQTQWKRTTGLAPNPAPSPSPSPASSRIFRKSEYIAKPQISSRYPLRMRDVLRP